MIVTGNKVRTTTGNVGIVVQVCKNSQVATVDFNGNLKLIRMENLTLVNQNSYTPRKTIDQYQRDVKKVIQDKIDYYQRMHTDQAKGAVIALRELIEIV